MPGNSGWGAVLSKAEPLLAGAFEEPPKLTTPHATALVAPM
ncbi:hypothetical protein BURPS1710b_3187 [Burkholderia pseudomallei 1710b]|uniref:Uncharacterized protein n=1 Tax=Burkholderia pseudomallei (strain 1710b) TaxID=320372 RepID=Q3JPE3_BURP1|nr:hypothetical protein BURPS1710b_3187 [Burkholderia pseudomallei 1710b]